MTWQNSPFEVIDWSETNRRTDYGNKGYFDSRGTAKVALLAVHHVAGEGDIEAVNRYHQSKNWCRPPTVCHAPHITYHYFINPAGVIYLCNYAWESSWHASKANDISLGICLQGNFDVQRPTAQQITALYWLLDKLRAETGVPRSAVRGHGELTEYGNSSSCPGRYLLPHVKHYRAQRDKAAPAPQPQPKTESGPDWEQRYIEALGVADWHRGSMLWAIQQLTAGSDDEDSAERLRRVRAALELAVAGQWVVGKDGRIDVPKAVEAGVLQKG